MLTLSKVVEYGRVEGKTDEVEVISENPYIRLSQDEKALYIQNGEVYTGENTTALKYNEIPEWFWKLAKGCSKEGRDRVGLVLPEEKTNTELDEEEVPVAKYDCPEPDCLASVPLTSKGIHMGMHTRKRNAEKRHAEKVAKKEATVLDNSVAAAANEGIVYKVD